MKTHPPLSKIVGYLRGLDKSLSDGDLLRQFAEQGDNEAFALLVRRHGSLVFGVCWRILRHVQDAEDAVQATFVVLARRAATVAWKESVAGWLHEVAVRVSLEARGKLARLRGREQLMENLPEKARPEQANQSELSEVLDQELSRLSEKYRAPLVLCYLEGQTRDEAAEQLGWTLSKVKRRLEHGRDLLRQRLERRGLTLGAALTSVLLVKDAQASFPAALTVKAVALATTEAAEGSFALELAGGVLKSMFVQKIKMLGLIVFAVLGVSLGAGLLAQQALSPAEEPPRPVFVNQESGKKDNPVKDKSGVKLALGHGGMVRSVAFTPDGKRLAVSSFDGTFRLWHSETGQEAFTWRVPGENSTVAVSHDGKRIAGGNSNGELLIWELDSGKNQIARRTGEGHIYAVNFAPDGNLLATANQWGTVSLWDAHTGARVRTIRAHQGRVWCVAFAPDGTSLASGGEDGLIRFWEVSTGREIRTVQAHLGHVASLDFSNDGKKLVSSDMQDTIHKHKAPSALGRYDTIRIWDLGTGKQLLQIETPLTHWVSFSPDGTKLASADRFGKVHLWDAVTGARLCTWKAHTSPAMCVQFDHEGKRLASSSEDGMVHIWTIKDTN